MSAGFARPGSLWRLMVRAAGTGLVAGVAAVAFLLLEEVLVGLLWGEELPTRP